MPADRTTTEGLVPGDEPQPTGSPIDEEVLGEELESEGGTDQPAQQNHAPRNARGSGEWPDPDTPAQPRAPGSAAPQRPPAPGVPHPPYDAPVVGGGVAGLAAATQLGRYQRRTLLLDAGEPRNRSVEQAHGYLGDGPVDPGALRVRVRAQLAAYATVERLGGRVEWVTGSIGEGFRVGDATGELAVGRRIVLATGVVDQLDVLARHNIRVLENTAVALVGRRGAMEAVPDPDAELS